jgi:hypothetical protein
MWLPVDWLPADMHGKERLKDKIGESSQDQ